jgi:N6-adenosine-specific RNA methylase IME4
MLSTTRMIALDEIAIGVRMRALRPEKVDELAGSIKTQGLLQPIAIRPRLRKGYALIVGRHRLEAHRKLGLDKIRAEIRAGIEADAALLAEIDENLIRGELWPAERALHVGRRKELYEIMYPETKKGKAPGAGRGKGKKKPLEESKNQTFVRDTATKTGKGRSTIALDAQRAKNCVVLDKIVGTVLDEGAEIDALCKLPEAEQRKLAKRVAAGEKISACHVANQLRRKERERDLAHATKAASKALGKKLYGVLYADPPWRFELYNRDSSNIAVERHYPTMTLEEIAKKKIPAAKNCVLFLWATVPMLPHALAVMSAWGFEYKSACGWHKDRAGTGYWFRGALELLLVGTRGNVPAPASGEQWPQVIEAPRGRHSEKPEVFAEMIGKLFPHVPKLEMFARKARPGFDAWGNEID